MPEIVKLWAGGKLGRKSNHFKNIESYTYDINKFKIYQKIKTSFDPKGIINPGKMYMGI